MEALKKTETSALLETVRRAMQAKACEVSVIESGEVHCHVVERRGLGLLTLPVGLFWQYDFHIDDAWEKYSVIVKAQLDEETLLPVFAHPERLTLRIDSGCETGQVFQDLTCECRDQLHQVLVKIAAEGEGMVICIPRQDGRGKGLPFKLGTLWLQNALNIDTVESATMLAGSEEIDVRTYGGIIGILKFFGIPSCCAIYLASNNPRKAHVFAENGYEVADYIPVIVEPTEHTAHHLRAKQEHLGHRHLVR